MNNNLANPQSKLNTSVKGLILALLFLLSSCSQGIRLKNLVNYPVTLSSLDALDTLKKSPDIVKFTGLEEVYFRNFNRNIYIQGRHESRPRWVGDDQGCFEVQQGAIVYISDFNFQGTTRDTALIRVSSGHLILENCEFTSSDFWAIEVDSGAFLELRNVHFSAQGSGAILVNGGIVKIADTQFDRVSKTAVYVTGGELLEIHNSIFSNTMGSALNINSVHEVWLDSVRIIDSFQDGVIINECDYVLLNQLELRENGRHGLSLSNASICGIMNLSAMGNLVFGIEVNKVDTLRILNSEFVGNAQSGGIISNTHRSRMAGIRVGHNGGGGLQFSKGQELWINRSSFQANLLSGLGIDSIAVIKLEQLSLVNNGQGIHSSHFDSLLIHNSLLSSNRGQATSINDGQYVSVAANLVKGNSVGLGIQNILHLNLDSNRVETNKLGNNIQSISNLKMLNNVWMSNESGGYFSDIGSMSSQKDQWLSNLDTGFEIFSVEELLIEGARIHNNRKGAHLNEASLKLESSSIDSSRDVGLKLMNGSLVMHNTSVHHNGTGIELAEGTQAKITQSKFFSNELTISAAASVSLTMSFSTVTDSKAGIRLGNYSQASYLSNQFRLMDGYCVELVGPNIQSLLMRQNVMTQTGGILNSKSVSGEIDIQSNTFANNSGGFLTPKRSLSRLDHNIFYQTPAFDPQLMRDAGQFKWNCIYPVDQALQADSTESRNIFSNPDFGANFYLKASSPCLNGGKNGLLIGALGSIQEDRPSLKP